MQVLVKAKSIFSSRTFWLGAAEILTGVGALATDLSSTLEAGEPISWLLIGKGVITIVLRYVTKQPVSVTPGVQAMPVDAPEPRVP